MNVQANPSRNDYLGARMAELGISQEDYTYTRTWISRGDIRQEDGSIVTNEHLQSREYKLFDSDELGNIVIRYFNLEGQPYRWKKKDTRQSRDFVRKRLREPKGDMKYFQEAGSPQFPFFNPSIITKYEQAKTGVTDPDGKLLGKIDVLFLVEGEFKSFKGSMVGLDIIGIPSIHGFYNGDVKGRLHEDIEELIVKCQVNKVVFLVDADILSLKLQNDKDLFKRPNSFYSAIKGWRESVEMLLDDRSVPLKDCYLMHIDASMKDECKGLDDLLCRYTAVTSDIIDDIMRLNFSKKYFKGFVLNDQNKDLKKIYSYLGLNSPDEFYRRYQEFINTEDFLFNRRYYRYNNETDKIELIPERNNEDSIFLEIQCRFYKKVMQPNYLGKTTLVIKPWLKSNIIEKHGKKFLQTIPSYDGFVTIPSHVDYRPVINGFYNSYHRIKHIPEEGEFEHIKGFVQHIFGEQYELGLDYIQLLYLRPTQMLPILCLVSTDRNTGKSHFLLLLEEIFGLNLTWLRNEDFESQFNEDWIDKLIIGIDETFIDKKQVAERIKSLSTAKRFKVEGKGKDREDRDFFGKIILLTNNEENFLPIDDEEIRFWVRKIPALTNVDKDILSKMSSEVPAFLHFLSNRQMKSENKTRMWFTAEEIKTEALEKAKAFSKSFFEKEFYQVITDYLIEFELNEAYFTLRDLRERLKESGLRVPDFQLSHFIKKQWVIEPRNSSYQKYSSDGSCITLKGRYFTFTRAMMGLTEPAKVIQATIADKTIQTSIPLDPSWKISDKEFPDWVNAK